MTDEQQHRWQLIKDGYHRRQQMGDSEDRAGQMVQQMVALNQSVTKVAQSLLQDQHTQARLNKEIDGDKV